MISASNSEAFESNATYSPNPPGILHAIVNIVFIGKYLSKMTLTSLQSYVNQPALAAARISSTLVATLYRAGDSPI